MKFRKRRNEKQMASNPKDFQATPWSHSGKVDKSGPSKPLKHNATRPHTPAPTSMDHFKPTPKSGQGYKAFGHTGTAMGEPYAKSSDRTEMKSGMEMPAKIKKSKPEVAVQPKKWHKKGKYDMTSPS